MNTILICPAERPVSGLLARTAPLSNVPLLGQTLLEYWMAQLAVLKPEKVLVLAHDRSELAKSVLGEGERWGLSVQTQDESRELTAAQALLKYGELSKGGTAKSEWAAIVMDHLPQAPSWALFASYADFFGSLLHYIPLAKGPDRVRVREIATGIWASLPSQISGNARLHPPCWIGRGVLIGSGAVIGPRAIIEDGAVVDAGAAVLESHIGPNTYVGRDAELERSMAWGSTLLNWRTGSAVEVPDPFLLCALRAPRQRTSSWLRRISELGLARRKDAQFLWKHLLVNREG